MVTVPDGKTNNLPDLQNTSAEWYSHPLQFLVRWFRFSVQLVFEYHHIHLVDQLNLTTGTEYEKEIKVHDWICQNISYDEEGSNTNNPTRMITSHSIFGVFAHHQAQCEGIAKAVKVLLNAVNVRCIVVNGEFVKTVRLSPMPGTW